MRAFVLEGYGAIADHVRLAELADPVAGPEDVLIEIQAASLNPIDFKIVRGDLKRVSKYRLPRPFGFDACGVVLSSGARAARFKPGDAVYARASRETIGTFAEKIALPEQFVALKPVSVSHGGGRVAAAGGADHAAGIREGWRPRRPAHPDPRRRRRHRHFRGSICEAYRSRGHLDHQFEECGFRQIARR